MMLRSGPLGAKCIPRSALGAVGTVELAVFGEMLTTAFRGPEGATGGVGPRNRLGGGCVVLDSRRGEAMGGCGETVICEAVVREARGPVGAIKSRFGALGDVGGPRWEKPDDDGAVKDDPADVGPVSCRDKMGPDSVVDMFSSERTRFIGAMAGSLSYARGPRGAAADGRLATCMRGAAGEALEAKGGSEAWTALRSSEISCARGFIAAG